jgi:cobalt/nickel transport system permease protein
LHHVVLERWSRGTSLIHARDARIKLILLVGFLAVLATAPRISWSLALFNGAMLVLAILLGRLPLVPLLVRAAVVLPFSATFAVISAAAGEPDRAAALVLKSYLSATAVLVLAGTTPLPRLLRALESLGTPHLLVLVVQFLYRYLFVISEQAQHMRQAALCRGGSARRAFSSFQAAAGAVSVLFARSYARAQGVHEAMLSRGFEGRMGLLSSSRIVAADIAFLVAGLVVVVGARLAEAAL